ncbi:hypothetical protein BN946_scf184791.g33 [Trametes cinnabarina]|uniref:Methyltransferase domain-containing protein n=1 Tax=Pycnoporus cinnabarinus TaxID=5643 RepID=A0A060SAM0_PYCCI|nr:hypothetical protein BN946_scf184791.g33 [Trametes cinnabarina]
MSDASAVQVELNPQTHYVMPPVDPEKERLHKQYIMKKMLTGWNAPVPKSIDVSSVSHVLDVGAGTCAWIRDFAAMEQIPKGVHLYACDIDTKFFPDRSETDKFGITTFKQDVTTPFPENLHGKFDLIRISFLFMCLTEDGWNKAIQHCKQVLKPEAILLIDEADPILYPSLSELPPEDATSHDFEKHLNRPDWLGKANRIYAGFSKESGFVPNLTFTLPTILREAGFEVVDTNRIISPIGKLCPIMRPDVSEAGLESFTMENPLFIFRYFGSALLAKGKLTTPDGASVTSPEGLQRILKEIEEGFRTEGAVTYARYCVAKKL